MDKYFKQVSTNEFTYYPEDKKYYTVSQKEKDESLNNDICIDSKAMAAIKKIYEYKF